MIIGTGVSGPHYHGMFFLILGRASRCLKGFSVTPSVVDAEYFGEIKILAAATKGPLTIKAGERLAQAFPLPLMGQFPHQQDSRGASSPGSSDIYWVQQLTEKRLLMTLWLDGKRFQGLVDTGVYATII